MKLFDDLFDGHGQEERDPDPSGETSFEGVTATKGTAKAILVKLADGTTRWVPRSQIDRGSEVSDEGDTGTLLITEWLATRWEEEGDGGGAKPEASVEVAGVTCMRETEAAIQVRAPGLHDLVWLPKSHVVKGSEVTGDGDTGTLKVTAWIASQKGLDGGPAQEKPFVRGGAKGARPQAKRTAQDDLYDGPQGGTPAPSDDPDDEPPF